MARRIAIIAVSGDVTTEDLMQELATLRDIWSLDYDWEVEFEVEQG